MKYTAFVLAVGCFLLAAITAMSVPCQEVDCGGPPAGPNCQNVSEFSPNGCFPCRICLDEVVNNENLACPQNPFWFHTERSEPICNVDADCGPTEKCCFWSENKHCLTGIDMTPRQGSCPASNSTQGCIADFAGCQYDSQCEVNEKCCLNDFCRYSECKGIAPPAPPAPVVACTEIGCGPAPGPDCQLIETVRPNGPGCEPVCRICRDAPTNTTEPPRACTKRGCGAPPAEPDCQLIEEVRPNGPGCEPVCRVCRDAPTNTTEPPTACTLRGCGAPPAGPDCQLIEEVRPNGPGCEPVCRVCGDNTTTQNLACPQEATWFHTPRTEPQCQFDSDCTSREKCCQWGATKHCLTGIDTLAKPGVCPVLNSPHCKADYGGCRYDSECPGSEKCCRNDVCGYGECSGIAVPVPVPAPVTRVCTEIGCGPAPGPDCQTFEFVRPNGPGCDPECRVCADPPTTTTERPRACTRRGCGGPLAGPDCLLIEEVRPNGPGCEPVCRICRDTARENLACPRSQFWFHTERSEPRCQQDSDCRSGSKCCSWSGSKHCLTGVSMVQKPGSCPVPPPTSGARYMNCRMDYVGCTYDSECHSTEKCCRHAQCGYGECKAPAPLHTEAAPCTEIGCGPAPGPECQTFKFVRPNGPGCEPQCTVCADPPTTTTTAVPTSPQICQMRWQLECPTGDRGQGSLRLREFRASSDFYRPMCKYVRRRVCF